MEIFQFREFKVDTAARTVKREEKALTLNRRAFDVLVYLLRNPGKVISKDELLKAVWADSFVDENSLAQSISALRKALEDKPGENAYIITLPGRGYQFTCPVQMVSPKQELAASSPADSSAAATNGFLYQEKTTRTVTVTENSVQFSQASRRRPWVLVGAAASACMIVLTAWLSWRHVHRIPPDPIVVIAEIENMTGDVALSDALNSAITTDLKQSPYLNFVSAAHMQETLTQMQQKKNTPLTSALAREVCLRNNAQVLLKGVVAKLGQKYLLTLDATYCTSGNALASSKSSADNIDAIPAAIDKASADMRKKLGESRTSIHRFDTPLLSENTGSFEALRSYSNARRLASEGKWTDAIALFQRAIDLDPKFAVAYSDLGGAYRNIGDRAREATYLTKAYELREAANERDRLFITASYHRIVTGNLKEALRAYRTSTEIYSHDADGWGDLADLYTQLGQAESAIAPARKSLELEPDDASSYVILGRALMHAGQLEEAQSICKQAIAKKLDGDDLHSLLLEVDVARNDDAGVVEQINWGWSHAPAARVRLDEALLAFSRGKMREGQDILATIASSYKQAGLTRSYVVYSLASSRILADTGHLEEARTLLDTQTPPEGVMDPLVAMVEVGRTDQGNKILNQELALHPENTLWTSYRAPQIRAASLIGEKKPKEAVEALRPALPYEFRELEVPYLRGVAYLSALQPVDAEREFRKVVDHRGVSPLSHYYALAHLGLGRALAQQNKIEASRAAYEQFFVLWKDAQPDEPLLRQARLERDHSSN